MPLALPGVDDRSTTSTLEDQVAATVAAVDTLTADQDDTAVIVGHSAASSLAWILADRRPEAVERVLLIGGFPGSNATAYADFFEPVNGLMAFPGWEPFEGPDSADLDAATRQRLAAEAVPVPEGVSRGTIQLFDQRRFDVPVTLVCPEYSPEDAMAWIRAGDIPELANARYVSYVDIDSGHWPMVSRPAELARVIDTAATGG